jgi:hypothetical protein
MRWVKWGQWCAHLHDGEQQVCATQHGRYLGMDTTFVPKTLGASDLTSHGEPYGRVCERCRREFRRRTAAAVPAAERCARPDMRRTA